MRKFSTERCRYARAAPGKCSLVEFKGHNSTSDQQPQTVLINYLPHSEGLFLDLKIEKESVKLLVDTGANHSILSMHLFNKLKLSENQIQTLRNVNIITATGESFLCLGQIVLPVVVDKQQILQNFWVADIQDEGILGLDFLSENKCIVTIDPPSLERNSLLVPSS